MSGEDNDPPTNGGAETGHGGQGQAQGGQQPSQGGQGAQGVQQPPQGGQGPPQGGQQPPQGGQQPPQGGQYGGQPRGYGGPSTVDKITNALGSPVGKGYVILTALLTATIGVATGIVMSLTSLLNGSFVVGPLVLTSLGAGSAGLGLGGDVLLVLSLATFGGAFLAKTLDEDGTTVMTIAGVSSFVGALVLGVVVGMALILNFPEGTSEPAAADAFVGAVLLGIGALLAGVGGAFVADRFDPHDQSQPAGGYAQGAPAQQPPQGGQGPR